MNRHCRFGINPGKSLLFGRSVNGIKNIWRFDLPDHALTQITFGSGPGLQPHDRPLGHGNLLHQRKIGGISDRVQHANEAVGGHRRRHAPRNRPSRPMESASSMSPSRANRDKNCGCAEIDGKNKVKIASAEVIGTGAWSRDSSRLLYGDYSSFRSSKSIVAAADGSSMRVRCRGADSTPEHSYSMKTRNLCM